MLKLITWILGPVLILWCIIRRFTRGGKVEGFPLSMPRGTVRAILTIMIVAFPFSYLFLGLEIPPVIISSIFIVVAFYFEVRRGEYDNLLNIVKQTKDLQKYKEERKKEKKPLYLPQFTIRILLLALLISVIVINYVEIFGPSVDFVTTNTLFNLLLIIITFIIGLIFRAIGHYRRKNKIIRVLEEIPDYQSKSNYELFDVVKEKEPSLTKTFWKSLFSIVIFLAITTALLMYTFDFPINIIILSYSFPLQDSIMLLVPLYYGFRD